MCNPLQSNMLLRNASAKLRDTEILTICPLSLSLSLSLSLFPSLSLSLSFSH
ncbi:MAG: hypothetical protein ACRC4N_13395 [Gammaproteobacteria bacterium]